MTIKGLYCLHELFFPFLMVENMNYNKRLKWSIGFSVQIHDNNISQHVNKNESCFSEIKKKVQGYKILYHYHL